MTETEPAIHRAARLGDLPALERLLAEGADIELRHDADKEHGSQLRQLTPLMTAARSIDGATDETILWLLERGASLHAVSGGGVTAAWYAAGKGGRWHFDPWRLAPGHAARLKVLLDAGLDPNEASCTGRSLLSEACYAGDPDAVKLLLERNVSPEPVPARPNKRNDFRSIYGYAVPASAKLSTEQIPLFGAVESGSVECVELLLAKGARLDHLSKYDDDLLDVALSKEDHYAETFKEPSSAYVTIAELLLDAGVPLDRKRSDGATRLYWAAFCQQEYGVRFLLERGASLGTDARGCTPLYAICWHAEFPPIRSQEPIIRMLVAAGVPLKTPECSALCTAIFGDVPNAPAVRLLLELGANPNETLDDGSAPLHWAAGECSLDSVKALLAHGGDPLHRNHSGDLPIDVARRKKTEYEERAITARERPKINTLTKSDYQYFVNTMENIIALLETAASER